MNLRILGKYRYLEKKEQADLSTSNTYNTKRSLLSQLFEQYLQKGADILSFPQLSTD